MKPSATESASLLATCGLAALLVVASANPASAATTFLGGDLNATTSWTNGVPSAGNPGSINVGGYVDVVPLVLGGGVVDQGGGTITISPVTQGFNLQNATWNMTGGEIIARYFQPNGAACTFNISGGTITLNNQTGTKYIGTVTSGTLNISGSATLNATTANAAFVNTGAINFSSGWSGTWTHGFYSGTNWRDRLVAGADIIKLDGIEINAAIFDANFTVSGDGKTLSMIPEPGSLGLVLFSLVSLLGCRRR